MSPAVPALAGVDGCRAGWVAAVRFVEKAEPRLCVASRFADLVGFLPEDAIVAVDMPIGLPERIGSTGRACEAAARGMLRRRRASLFPIPPRPAVEAGQGPFANIVKRRQAFEAASRLARARSDPARGFSIQAFGIFPKIVELDRLLRARPPLGERVFESHPELAFAVLNGDAEMVHPKTTAAGATERMALLEAWGIERNCLVRPLPRLVKRDDWLDACVMLLVAERCANGEASCFPERPERDAHGLPMAIRT